MFELINSLIVPLVAAMLVSVLATELTWFHVFATIADGTTSQDNVARYTNQTRAKAHIIKILENHAFTAAAAAESFNTQLAKQNTFANTDGDREFRLGATLVTPPNTSTTPVDGGVFVKEQTNFLRGQMTVDFGDSLFLNQTKTSGGLGTSSYWIGLEYED